MIRYALLCEHDHTFESWFDNSDAYDKLQKSSLIECPVCGSVETRKALMTPQIQSGRSKTPSPSGGAVARSDDDKMHQLQKEAMDLARKIREHIKDNADDVGSKFAEEARKIHFDEVKPHNIYGSATAKEVTELAEDGIDFAPLPDLPEDKN